MSTETCSSSSTQYSLLEKQALKQHPTTHNTISTIHNVASQMLSETASICYNRSYLKYWNRQASVNSVDPDQMLQTVASDQGLHHLQLIHQFI